MEPNIKVKRKRKYAKIIATTFFMIGIFLLIWSYVGETYDIADFSESDSQYGEVADHSILYTENHITWAIAGIGFILLGFLFKYRKKIKSKIKHVSRKALRMRLRH
jgi:hypothetical protein